MPRMHIAHSFSLQNYLPSTTAATVAPKTTKVGTSLVVQWLSLHASKAGSASSIPGQGTKIPHAARCGQKGKKEQPK